MKNLFSTRQKAVDVSQATLAETIGVTRQTTVLPKHLQTRLEDGHRNAIIEASSATLGLVPVAMIDLDVSRSEFLGCSILVPATGPLTVCRGELDAELVVLLLAWSPLDLGIAIRTGAELGAVDPRDDRRRAKRARLGTNLVDSRGSSQSIGEPSSTSRNRCPRHRSRSQRDYLLDFPDSPALDPDVCEEYDHYRGAHLTLTL